MWQVSIKGVRTLSKWHLSSTMYYFMVSSQVGSLQYLLQFAGLI